MFVSKRRTRFDLLLLGEEEFYLSDESVILLAAENTQSSFLDAHKYAKRFSKPV